MGTSREGPLSPPWAGMRELQLLEWSGSFPRVRSTCTPGVACLFTAVSRFSPGSEILSNGMRQSGRLLLHHWTQRWLCHPRPPSSFLRAAPATSCIRTSGCLCLWQDCERFCCCRLSDSPSSRNLLNLHLLMIAFSILFHFGCLFILLKSW